MDRVIDNIKREVFKSILTAGDNDEERDIPLYRDIYHVIGSVRCAVLLAKRRGIDCKVAEIAMCLHDISRIEDGKLEDHAVNSGKRAEEILKLQGVDQLVIDDISKAINLHVNKSEKNDEFDELLKDADLLDTYLNGDVFKDDALIGRIEKIKKELNIS